MPIYEYECESCKHLFELIQKFSDLPVNECPLCKGSVKKLISSSGISFKGSGWYITDYSNKLKNKPDPEKKTPGADGKENKSLEKSESPKETVPKAIPPVPASKPGESKK